MTAHLAALLLGFCLDLLLGDPHWAPHPVRAVGALISGLEAPLRRVFPKTKGGELAAGGALVALTLGIPTGLTLLVLWACGRFSPWLALAAQTLLCYQLLAARSLGEESGRVYRALKDGDLAQGRRAVSRIVGRDTQCLDEAGVVRAAVETVAENTCDGVVAPLLYLALGGPGLGMLYKAASTMDSMVGYKSERYRYFGRPAARLDDVLNFIPARVAGVLTCLGAAAWGYDARGAWRVFRRDRKKHESPNSAHTEAACAGALGVALAGPGRYSGVLVDKPVIGDACREVEPLDILRAGRLMYAAAFFALLLFCGVPLLALLFPV